MKRFLKGYIYREFVLKSFEAQIEGEYDIMPNLIEEFDQIYLLSLKANKKIIKRFDVFYLAEYANQNLKCKKITDGKPFELINDNFYFIEIKKINQQFIRKL